MDKGFQPDKKNWGDPKKVAARQDTVIDMYRKLFFDKMPPDKQYWSMCSQCADHNGNVKKGYEFDHVVSSGLIVPSQFNGVEINPNIHNLNIECSEEAHWYCSDFYQTMVKKHNHDEFNPHIINADLVEMPKRASKYISKIMYFLVYAADDVMLVANMIVQNPWNMKMKTFVEGIIYEFENENAFQFAWQNGWTWYDKTYTYNGTDNNRTVMTTLIFYKKQKRLKAV